MANNNNNDSYMIAEAESENLANFLSPLYDLEERPIPQISSNFSTPFEIIKKNLNHMKTI